VLVSDAASERKKLKTMVTSKSIVGGAQRQGYKAETTGRINHNTHQLDCVHKLTAIDLSNPEQVKLRWND